MRYEELDREIVELGRPKGIAFSTGAVGLLALKKLAGEVLESPRKLAPSAEMVRATVAEIAHCEIQKEASGFPHHAPFFRAYLEHMGGQCTTPQEKVAGLHNRIALEEQSMVLKEKLSGVLSPSHPVYPTIRQFIAEDQALLVDLRQVPAQEKTAGQKLVERAEKIASKGAFLEFLGAQYGVPKRGDPLIPKKLREAAKKVKGKHVAAGVGAGLTAAAGAEGVRRYLKGKKKTAQPVVVPPPNNDSPEGYVARERQLAQDQAVQELAHTKMQLNQTAMMAQQAQQEGQMAQEELAAVQEQNEMTQQELAAAQQESQASQQQAVEAEGRAAQHATQKMQLGMRVQQMRQMLAEIATQDPVTETAAGVNDLAAQGAPATPDQQAEAAAEEEQAAAAEEAAAAGPPTAGQQKEVQQAENAQAEADEQAAEAQQAMGPAAAPATPATAPAGGMAAA